MKDRRERNPRESGGLGFSPVRNSIWTAMAVRAIASSARGGIMTVRGRLSQKPSPPYRVYFRSLMQV